MSKDLWYAKFYTCLSDIKNSGNLMVLSKGDVIEAEYIDDDNISINKFHSAKPCITIDKETIEKMFQATSETELNKSIWAAKRTFTFWTPSGDKCTVRENDEIFILRDSIDLVVAKVCKEDLIITMSPSFMWQMFSPQVFNPNKCMLSVDLAKELDFTASLSKSDVEKLVDNLI